MEESKVYSKNQGEEIFSVGEYLKLCLRKWKWFLLSVIVFCGLGVLFVLRSQPVYQRTMSLLVKDGDSKSAMGDLAGAFSTFGLGGGKSNVYNEILALSSPAVMYEVVDRLDLNMNYVEKGLFHGTTLFGTDLPFTAILADVDKTAAAGFRMESYPNGDVRLYKFYKGDFSGVHKLDGEVRGKIDGKAIRTPIGRVVLSANPDYVMPKQKMGSNKKNVTYYVSQTPFMDAVDYYQGKLQADLADVDADVIDLTIKDPSVQRGVAILNTVLEVYTENWIKDKNKIATASSDFIEERLKIIQKELGVVDDEVSRYKSSHLIPDLRESAKINIEQDAALSNQILGLTNSLSVNEFVKEYVTNAANSNSVIPMNTGLGNGQLESQISNYNSMLLTRNNLARSSSDSNPLVLDYDAQLRGLRDAIVKSVGVNINALKAQLGNIKNAKSKTESQLSSGPTQARDLLSIERQQKVKESLYLFLLQKREENELTQTFTSNNVRILTPPMGPQKPVSPKKSLILGSLFLFSLIFPAAWLGFGAYLDDKVRSRKDLERMKTPFAGEIPMVVRRHRKGLNGKKIGKIKKGGRELESVIVAVRPESRDEVSESFRIIRGNIDMMVKNQPTNVFMLTSFNPGSGKSFITFNLAASFALKGKKVLIIDADLRHGSTSQFVGMPSKGLSSYLNGGTDDWKSLVREVDQYPGVYVLPIGQRPPNPSELLDNGRLASLLEESRQDYDYVFIDCPPVDVVVDTQIVGRYVDRTLFVVRAGVLLKSSISEIDALYDEKRFKNMSIILNGTDSEHSRSHNYGSYGYYGN